MKVNFTMYMPLYKCYSGREHDICVGGDH